MMAHNMLDSVRLTAIVGGGQAIGTLDNGKKAFVWGGLPGELVEFRITKKKSKLVEGVVSNVLEPSKDRAAPRDTDSYLSTSPWQIMSFAAEQRHKAALIDEAFALHHVSLPHGTTIYTDNHEWEYRNKLEFSWYGSMVEEELENDATSDNEVPHVPQHLQPVSPVGGHGAKPVVAHGVAKLSRDSDLRVRQLADDDGSGEANEKLDLAFFRRGSKGKIPVDSMSLARPEIMTLARTIRDLFQSKGIMARQLKSLLIRCNQAGECVWQLYTKEKLPDIIIPSEVKSLPCIGGEIIYSDPRSPANRITERLASFGQITLTDYILGIPFRYATESFFQVNIPVYEHALKNIETFVTHGRALYSNSQMPTARTVDLYAGVGTIGLTIGGDNCTLVEIDEHAVREMRRNITDLGSSSRAILAPSEQALEHIVSDATIIVDPPRAGLHQAVIDRLLDVLPARIIYLSCNPVTQARDVTLLFEKYHIVHHQGYNFFPRTPHIEHLIILDRL